MSKPANLAIKERGVELRPLDTTGSQEALASALKGIDILVSAIGPMEQLQQIPLATAAKTAGVKLFAPCAFVTVMPAGVHILRDQKEEVYNHIKRLHLPYVIIDCGWWYQISFPELPSGKIDYAVGIPGQAIAGDGNVPSALTDLRDIGPYVARVIKDERAVNKYVLIYNEMWTPHQVYDLLEKLSGEKLPRKYNSLETIEKRIEEGMDKFKADPHNLFAGLQVIGGQYMRSWGIKGENTPEYAKYLGYVTSKELYPDMKFINFEDYLKDVVDGKAKGVYDEMKQQFGDAMKEVHKGYTG
jgi:hypothetical protein